ncbi:hypothetical protein D3C80_398810 [compost metagenome]
MDDSLKLAYAALEKWRNEVTVDEFIKDNKRLNSNKNIHSPTINEFLNNCADEVKSETQILIENNWDFSEYFIPLFEVKAKEELINFEKIFNFLIIDTSVHKKLSEDLSADITSIVVHFKNHEVHFDKPRKELKLEDPKGIDILFNRSKNISAIESKKAIGSEIPHVSKMFDYASC